jgi:DNA-binding NarL/FixJ family response regulator
MKKIRIILADDHQLFREGLEALLKSHAELKILASVKDGETLFEAIEQFHPDVVLSDISMPGKTGIEVCTEITQTFPEVKFIMLSMYNNEVFFVNSLKAGAKGFLSKEISRDELLKAIQTVYHGGEYFDKKVSHAILKEYAEQKAGKKPSKPEEQILSAREKEIIRLVAESYSNGEIAEKLKISVRTVNAHKNNIMRKLKLKNTVDIVKYALMNKMIKL